MSKVCNHGISWVSGLINNLYIYRHNFADAVHSTWREDSSYFSIFSKAIDLINTTSMLPLHRGDFTIFLSKDTSANNFYKLHYIEEDGSNQYFTVLAYFTDMHGNELL